MNKSEKAVKYMINVWDEVQDNWRESPEHVQQKFLEAETEQQLNKRELLLSFMKWVICQEGMTTNEKITNPEIFVDDYLKINK